MRAEQLSQALEDLVHSAERQGCEGSRSQIGSGAGTLKDAGKWHFNTSSRWPTSVFGHGSVGGVMALQSDLFIDTDEFLADATRVSDTLDSLTYLVCWNDEDIGMVQLYARLLQARLRGLGVLLRSTDPNVREVRARLCN
jgi:hypothetical protein